MIAVPCLLVLAYAVAINAYPSDPRCVEIHIGDVTNNPVPLKEVLLTPGVADWEVSIPEVPNCPNAVAGVTALVCDYDVAPTAKFADKYLILVHRNGKLQGSGSVTPTVYCPENYNNDHWPSNNLLPLPLNQLRPTNLVRIPPLNKGLLSPQNLWNQQPHKPVARPQ